MVVANNTASYGRRISKSRAHSTAVAGTKKITAPLQVTALKKPSNAGGVFCLINNSAAVSTGPDSFESTSSNTLMPMTSSVNSVKTTKRLPASANSQGVLA